MHVSASAGSAGAAPAATAIGALVGTRAGGADGAGGAGGVRHRLGTASAGAPWRALGTVPAAAETLAPTAPPSAGSVAVSVIAIPGTVSTAATPSPAKAHVTPTVAFPGRDRDETGRPPLLDFTATEAAPRTIALKAPTSRLSTTGTAPALGSPTAAGDTVPTQVPTTVRSPMP